MQPDSPNFWQPNDQRPPEPVAETPSFPQVTPQQVAPPSVAPQQATPQQPTAPQGVSPQVATEQAMPQAEPQLNEPAPAARAAFTWQTSEFVHHQKNTIWFVALAGIAVLLLVIDVLLVKSWTFGALIIVMAVAVAVVGHREPRLINYQLSNQGLQIDDKQFGLDDFRAFGVIQEGDQTSVRLVPNKRFMPMVSVYLPADQAAEIVDIFGTRLPLEPIEPDPLERLTQRLRF
ncbi:MAG TPA: hypothetical protein VF597_00315 [Candidatus Saccharimonadales bacterium]|jgi:hypothetical protein